MTSLDEIALRHGTDKSSRHHDYCLVYEQYFGALREEAVTLLELGVNEGRSIRMWREYFPNGTIVGVDSAKYSLSDLPGTYLYTKDQADPGLPDLLEQQQHTPFDIIIDDCSHYSDLTVASFKLLWPLLKLGGFYVIEDITLHDRGVIEFLKALADDVSRIEEYAYNVEWMWFGPDRVILKRRPVLRRRPLSQSSDPDTQRLTTSATFVVNGRIRH